MRKPPLSRYSRKRLACASLKSMSEPDGVHEGKVEDVVVVQIDDLLIASGVDPGQPPERLEKHDVGLG